MALQLRRLLLPHGYLHRAVTLATNRPLPATLHLGALKGSSSSIGCSHFFSAAAYYGKSPRSYLITNKSSFSSPSVSRGRQSSFSGSERRLAACSTVTDQASTSTTIDNGTHTKKDTAWGKISTKKKKKKKKTRDAKPCETAAETTEKASVNNQEEKKAGTSKSKKGVASSEDKNTATRPKRSTSAEESAVAAAAAAPAVAKNQMKTSADDGSGGERKPLVPLYPPTAKSVVVVESATKARVIQKYLGDMYQVLPSYGHVRDLAGRSRSVRPEDDFSMVWEVPAAAWTHLKSIRVALKRSDSCQVANQRDAPYLQGHSHGGSSTCLNLLPWPINFVSTGASVTS